MIYLYKCPKHGEFELEHSIAEKIEECPLCKEENIEPPQKLTRLISGGGTFILQGSGWAKDRYS